MTRDTQLEFLRPDLPRDLVPQVLTLETLVRASLLPPIQLSPKISDRSFSVLGSLSLVREGQGPVETNRFSRGPWGKSVGLVRVYIVSDRSRQESRGCGLTVSLCDDLNMVVGSGV